MDQVVNRTEGMHSGCPQCGGRLEYDIESRGLKCTSCGAGQPVEFYQVSESEGQMEVVEYRCPQCGAAVHTTQTNMVGYCSFCGAEVLFTQRMTNTRRPDKIVPFAITRDQCSKIYAKHMKKASFAPAKDRQAWAKEHFRAIYVPFYFYEEKYSGKVVGKYKTHSSDEQYTYTYEYDIDLNATTAIAGEMQCASAQMEPETADRLMMGVQEAQPFMPGYLCGFYAEAPDLTDEREGSQLELLVKEDILKAASKEAEKTILSVDVPERKLDEVSLYLMPVWFLVEKSGKRVLYTAISGIDGEIVCDTTVHQPRVMTLAAVLSVMFAALFLLFNNTFILRPKLVAALCAVLASAGYYIINGTYDRHAMREEQLEKRRKEKRCVLLSNDDILHRTGRRSLMSGLIYVGVSAALPASIGLAWLLSRMKGLEVFGLCIVGIFVLAFLYVLIGIPISGELKDRRSNRTFLEWVVYHFAAPAFVMLAVFMAHASMENMNTAVGGLVSDQGWLAPAICICSIISLFFSRPRKGCDKPDLALYVTSMVLTLATILLGFVSHQGWIFYALACALTVIVTVSWVRLTSKHNQHVTRPVPFFGGKEAGR